MERVKTPHSVNGLGDLGHFPRHAFRLTGMRVAVGLERSVAFSVVVVDERAVVRNGLVTALRAQGYDATGVSAGSEIDLRLAAPSAIVVDGERAEATIRDLHHRITASASATRLLVVVGPVVHASIGSGLELIDRARGAEGIATALSGLAAPSDRDMLAADPSATLLSNTERSILRLIAQGATAREAAAALGISPRTVENHKRRIFDRLGAATQAQAVSLAIRAGELSSLENAS